MPCRLCRARCRAIMPPATLRRDMLIGARARAERVPRERTRYRDMTCYLALKSLRYDYRAYDICCVSDAAHDYAMTPAAQRRRYARRQRVMRYALIYIQYTEIRYGKKNIDITNIYAMPLRC